MKTSNSAGTEYVYLLWYQTNNKQTAYMSPRPENGINRNLFVGLHYRAISKEAPVGNNRRCAGQNGVDAGHLEMQQSRQREEHLINLHYGQQLQDGGCSNGEHPERSTVHGTSRRTPRPRVQRAGLSHNLSHFECAFCFFVSFGCMQFKFLLFVSKGLHL